MNKDVIICDRKTPNTKSITRIVKNVYIIMILVSFYFSVNRVSAQINYWTPNIIPQNLFYSFIDLSSSLNWLSRSLNYGIYGWPNTYGIFNGKPLPYNAITPLNIYSMSLLYNLYGPLGNNAWLGNYNSLNTELMQGLDSEIYAVYSTILNAGIHYQKSYKIFILDITRKTTTLPAKPRKIATTLSSINEKCNCLEEETVYDYYHERNAQEYPLGYYFNFNAPYEFVSYEAMFDFSTGVTSFSNVGFNPERTQALVTVREQPRGMEVKVVLNKVNGFWIVRYVKNSGFSD